MSDQLEVTPDSIDSIESPSLVHILGDQKVNKDKLCFLICPIGSPDSETRSRSDKILKHVIIPAAADCGYRVIRADQIDNPGVITNQIVNHVFTADIVIADLSELNPNVMYELALRHGTRRPAIHIAEVGTKLPFDVQQSRAIMIDHRDLDSAAECRSAISQQIRAIEKDPSSCENPITVAFDLMALQKSDNPSDRTLADVLESLQELRLEVGRLSPNVTATDSHRARRARSHRALLPEEDEEEALVALARLEAWLIDQTPDSVTNELREAARERLIRLTPTLSTTSDYDTQWYRVAQYFSALTGESIAGPEYGRTC